MLGVDAKTKFSTDRIAVSKLQVVAMFVGYNEKKTKDAYTQIFVELRPVSLSVVTIASSRKK